MRLKLVPSETNVDFFTLSKITFVSYIVAIILALDLFVFIGLNFGIDFPLTEKTNVIGGEAHSFYKWAKNTYGIKAVPKWLTLVQGAAWHISGSVLWQV